MTGSETIQCEICGEKLGKHLRQVVEISYDYGFGKTKIEKKYNCPHCRGEVTIITKQER